MKKSFAYVSFYFHKYPARMGGYISALILNTAIYFKGFPTGLLIPTAMIIIILGEGTQRLEDKKTLKALYTENDKDRPDDDILLDMLTTIETRSESKGDGKR